VPASRSAAFQSHPKQEHEKTNQLRYILLSASTDQSTLTDMELSQCVKWGEGEWKKKKKRRQTVKLPHHLHHMSNQYVTTKNSKLPTYSSLLTYFRTNSQQIVP